MSTAEMTAIELLKERVFAAYQSRKFTAIWEIVALEVDANTACELDRAELVDLALRYESRIDDLEDTNADLQDQNATLRKIVASWAIEHKIGMTVGEALEAIDAPNLAKCEADNAALREFVAALDVWEGIGKAQSVLNREPTDDEYAQYAIAGEQVDMLRLRLATNHGIPLPDAEAHR